MEKNYTISSNLKNFSSKPFSNFANNTAERIDKIKSKFGHNNKKYKMFGIEYKDFEC